MRRCAAAALRRPGRHAVAPVGGRGVRPVRADRDRRRHQRAAGRSADPRLAPGTGRADRKRGHRHGGRQTPGAAGRFGGSRLVLTGSAGATPGGGSSAGSGTVDFSGGAPALDLKFDAARRGCSTATTSPRRHRPAGDPLAAGGGGTISGKLRLDSGRFTLGRATRRVAVPQLTVRHRAAAMPTMSSSSRSCSRGSSTSRSPAAI